jgi:hypothetical protein
MSDAAFADLERRLTGHAFPGGTFVVEEYERWLAQDAMQAVAPGAPLLHPVWVVLGALRGMGVTTDELMELADARPTDGVVFGETELRQDTPLRAGVEYRVRGGVTSIARRTGKRAGVFDKLVFELEILEADGAIAAFSSQTFIIRRGDSVAS